MTAKEFWKLYCGKWRSDGGRMNRHAGSWSEWTAEMTRFIHEMARRAKPGWVIVDKSISGKEQERWHLGSRKEYLALDGLWFPRSFGMNRGGKWCLPEVAIELQSYDKSYPEGPYERVALCLWKLLCVRARLRVLLAYIPRGWKVFKETERKLREELRHLLEKDCRRQFLIILEDAGNGDESMVWRYTRLENGYLKAEKLLDSCSESGPSGN